MVDAPAGRVNYRQSPSIKAARVKGMERIKNGERVTVKTTDGTWGAVEYGKYRGYIMMEYLKMEPEKSEEDASVSLDTEKVKPSEDLYYTTVQGDTLWKIASIHLGKGVRYKEIMKANGMKNTIIRPGMRLKIPSKE